MAHGLRVSHKSNEKLLRDPEKLRDELRTIYRRVANAIH